MLLEDKIENIALRLPELPQPPRKNLFQIMGVQSKETLNSRILSYFLNPIEDHELGALFFDSLIELYLEKGGEDTEPITRDFEIFTENSTTRASKSSERFKSIDISIDGPDKKWSLIIENKINHILNNPLDTYWDHKAEFSKIFGIILSLYPLSKREVVTSKGRKYINITHRELVNRVQANLVMDGSLSHTSLIYLNEYFKNIQSHYQNETESKPMNEIVNSLVKQRDELSQVTKKLQEAVKFIDNCVAEVFQKNGYERSSYYFIHPESDYQVRFWVNGGNEIILKNELRFVLESYGDTDSIIRENENEFFEYLQSSIKDNPFFIYRNEDNSRSRTHLVKYSNQNFLNEGEFFSDKFGQIIDEYFLEEGGIVDVIEQFLMKKDIQEINQKQ